MRAYLNYLFVLVSTSNNLVSLYIIKTLAKTRLKRCILHLESWCFMLGFFPLDSYGKSIVLVHIGHLFDLYHDHISMIKL